MASKNKCSNCKHWTKKVNGFGKCSNYSDIKQAISTPNFKLDLTKMISNKPVSTGMHFCCENWEGV